MFSGPRRTEFLSLAVVVSVGLNLFLAGVLLGSFPTGFGHRPRERHDIREELRKSLSPPGAELLIRAVDQVHSQFESRFRDAETGQQRKSELLSREPFDRSAFLAESREEHAQFVTGVAKADEIVADAIARLSLEDRQILAKMHLGPPLGMGRRPPPPRP
jgi:heavy-metal resistance protein